MKIIDAHIHYYKNAYFNQIAAAAGHENSEAHLRAAYQEYGVSHGVIMGNRALDLNRHQYPNFLSYCVGLDGHALKKIDAAAAAMVEEHFKRKSCVGLKLYPGYNSIYVYDDIYKPFYKLAIKYQKPVAIHTGATASSGGLLKYSHPLTVDEAATAYPEIQFIMCHFGSPWVLDAAAVMEKNPNVAADLSGILEGIVDIPVFLEQSGAFVQHLRTWISYAGDYSRFLYGTDWPLVNIPSYIQFVKALIPQAHWEAVFYHNANRIYKLGLPG